MSNVKEQIMEFLSEEGFRPEDTPFGIYFKCEGLNFYIHWDEEDAFYLSLSLPSIASTDENNRADALEVANKVNMNRKVVKCVIANDDVWVTAEQLLDTDPNYKDVIPRTIGMLMQARQIFYEEMRNL